MGRPPKEAVVEALKQESSARERGGKLWTDSLTIERRGEPSWSEGVPLPTRDLDLSTFQVHFHSAEAIVRPDPVEGEVRIPYVIRFYPGDMKGLLDALIRDLGKYRQIRFVNVSPDGTAKQLSELMGVPDPRDLREALHGFEEITEEWASPDGLGTEEITCLRGEWTPRPEAVSEHAQADENAEGGL